MNSEHTWADCCIDYDYNNISQSSITITITP